MQDLSRQNATATRQSSDEARLTKGSEPAPRQIRMAILDRDNTIVRVPKGIKHLCGEDPLLLVDGALEFLAELRRREVIVVVATNQPGIEQRNCHETLGLAARFHERLNATLARSGAHIDRFYVCPHLPADHCLCHKPRPGLFLQALDDFGIPAAETLAMGDSVCDVVGARRANITRSLLLKSWGGCLKPFRRLWRAPLIAHPQEALDWLESSPVQS